MSYEQHVAHMSLNRLSGSGRGGGLDRPNSPASYFGDPSLKLPPLVRDYPLPNNANAYASNASSGSGGINSGSGISSSNGGINNGSGSGSNNSSHRHRPPVASSRAMHQIQLEMEYDAEESENDSDRPSLPSLTEGMAQLGALSGDGTMELERGIHALCIFDPVSIPASVQPGTATHLANVLSRLPVVRSWGRWRWRDPPDLSDARIVEAIIIYERGFEVRPAQRCHLCRAGEGVSPQCIMMPSEARRASDVVSCSNCYYEGCAAQCNANASARMSPSSDKSLVHHEGDVLVDYMAVLEVIAALKRPPGADRDQSLATKARRIEVAALHIAQAAREWGEKMARGH